MRNLIWEEMDTKDQLIKSPTEKTFSIVLLEENTIALLSCQYVPYDMRVKASFVVASCRRILKMKHCFDFLQMKFYAENRTS